MSDMVFCRACGAKIHSAASVCPQCGAPLHAGFPQPLDYGFLSSIALCFNRYVQFRGRSPRSEYWYWILFGILVSIAANLLDLAANSSGIFSGIANLVLLLPNLAVFVRRLHDTDHSGWWSFLGLLPIVGWIILFVWTVKRGTRGPNTYGDDPLPGAR